jgi:hypothetical protein
MRLASRFWRQVFATAFLVTGTAAADAEGPHHFDIINHSSNTITITGTVQRCIEDGTSVNWPLTINPGRTYTVNWDDNNNWFAYDGWLSCTNRDKFVAFSISVGRWSGFLGITHRMLSGSNWYNGQFYGQGISVDNTYGTITGGSDGSRPPGNIVAKCLHNNYCFGPWSEMEMNNKDSYNWQRSYQTEDGWAFEIRDP